MIREIISNPKRFFFENFELKQTILKNTLWLSLAEGVSRFLKLFLIIYVARIFGATEYGRFNFALALASFLVIFSDLGIAQIFVREYKINAQKNSDFYGLISLKLFLLAITLILIFVSSFLITSDVYIRKIIILLGGFVSINTFANIFFALFQAKQKMQYQAIFQILGAILTTAFGFIVVFKMPSAHNLALGYLFSSIIYAILIFGLLFFKKIPLTLTIDWSVWKKYITLSWPLALTGILSAVWGNIDVLMMGTWGQITQVGWYNAAYKVISFVFIPTGIIYAVFFPALNQLINERHKSNEKLEKFFNVFLKIMIFLAFLFCIGGIVLAPQIISWLYGIKFLPSVLALRILLLMAGFNFLITPLSQWLILTNQQTKLFYIMMIGVVINVVLNVFLIPKFSLYGAAISSVISFFSMFLLLSATLQKSILIAYKQMNKMFVFVVISGAGLYYILRQPIIFNLHPLFSSTIGFLGYSSIFIILSLFFKNDKKIN